MIYQDPNPDEPTHPLIFRLPETGPELLRTILLDLGWKEYSFETPYYNLYFKPSRFTLTEYNSIQPYQRLNHFKNSTCLTKKDSLFRLLKKFQGIYGSVYEFFPKTLNLPNEYCKFVKEFTGNDGNRGARGVEGSENFWICKPVDKSRGRGIVVFNRIEKLQYDQSCVVQ
ncbi:putative tubulin polyglutamylase ttll2, partial [Nowakowskiella sp. JEL0407]